MDKTHPGSECTNKDDRESDTPQAGKTEARAVKRQREDTDTSGDRTEAEPDEKRRMGNFKLNPPTLIHGQAKPAPKEEDDVSKRNFLRPSTLTAPAPVTHGITSVLSSLSGKAVSSITQPALLGSSLPIPGQVSSKNPFLKTDDEKEPEVPFETTAEEKVKDKTSEADGSKEAASGGENVFLQMHERTSGADSQQESSGFIFGSKMKERVVNKETETTSESPGAAKTEEFLFGKNLSERVKVSSTESTNTPSLLTAHAESVIFHESSNTEVTASSCGGKLEENAAALYSVSNTVVVMPEVEIKTGEEDEKNVLQIQCKLHQYDSSNSNNWVERGRGNLRLNDRRLSSADCKFQSRLVMRTNGSLRLILNTKIWPTMTVDRASSKSIRISAQNEDGDIGVYLVTATINDAEQLYRAIEYRLLHLKQNAPKSREMPKDKIVEPDSSVKTSETDDQKIDVAESQETYESKQSTDASESGSVPDKLKQTTDVDQQSSLISSTVGNADWNSTTKTSEPPLNNAAVSNGGDDNPLPRKQSDQVKQIEKPNGGMNAKN